MGCKDRYYVHFPKLLIKRLDQFLETPRARTMGMSNKPELLRHVINEFLDEQEALYNNIDYIEDFILEMKDRDHVVLTFDNESQFKKIVKTFVKRGIDCNQINVLFFYSNEEQKFLESLDKIPNINSLFNSGEITMIPAEESAVNDSVWFDHVRKKLSDTVTLANNRLKTGLNFLGTVPGKLIEQGRYDEAMKVENTFARAIKEYEIPITGICLYRSLPVILNERLPEYHDLIIKSGTAGI